MKEYIKGLISRIKIGRVLKYLLYMFLVLVLQTMAITQVRPAGVCAFVLPAAVVAVGMFEGSVWGTLFGLLMGLLTDMFYVESTLIYTILFPCLAFAAGFVAQFFLTRKFPAYIITAIAALLITGVVQMTATSLYDVWSFSMIRVVLLQTLWSIPVAALLYIPTASWIE